jgi:O-antigen ligase
VAVGIAALAALLPPAVGVGLVVLLVGGLLVLRHPVWAVYALILSVPVQREALIAGRVTATQAIMVGTLAAWWAWTAVQQRAIRIPPFAVALAVYIGVMIVSLSVATNLSDAGAEISRWIVVLLAYGIIVNTIQTRPQVAGLIACFLLGALGEGLVGIWQVRTGQVPPSFFVGQGHDPEDLAPRAFGTIGMPNSYAGYLNMTLALALALSVYALFWAWRTSRGSGDHGAAAFSPHPNPLPAGEREFDSSFPTRAVRFLGAGGLWAVTGLAGLGFVFSYSRGGFVGLVVGLVAMAAALGRRGAAILGTLAAGTVLAVLLMYLGLLPKPLADRITNTVNQLEIYDVRGVQADADNFAALERLAHWQTAGNQFLSDPLLGVGVGNFNARFYDFSVAGWPKSAGHAHNYYLQTLAETGVLGFGAYLGLVSVAIWSGWRAVRRTMRSSPGWDSVVLIGAFGVLWAVIAHNVFEDLHVLNMGIHWAAVIALFTVVPRLAARTEGTTV